MEYRKAAIIPGTIKSSVHRKVNITIKRCKTKAQVKNLNPSNRVSTDGLSHLVNLRKNLALPKVIGPARINVPITPI